MGKFSIGKFNETVKDILRGYEFEIDIPFLFPDTEEASIRVRSFNVPFMTSTPAVLSWGSNFILKSPGKVSYPEWNCTFLLDRETELLNKVLPLLASIQAKSKGRIIDNDVDSNGGDITIKIGNPQRKIILIDAWIASVDAFSMGHEESGPLQVPVLFQYNKIDFLT